MRSKLSRSCRQRMGGPRGFTLIEIVLALLVLGMLLTVAYGGLDGIMSSTSAIQERRVTRAVSNSLLLRLTREFQLISGELSVLPPRESPKTPRPGAPRVVGTQERLENGGSGDSITFVAREAGQYVMDGTTHTGTVQITYRVERDPDQPRGEGTFYLIRDETPYKRPAEKAYEDTMTFPVVKNLVSFQLLYLNGESGEWLEEWGEEGGPTGLPSIIQFTVKLRTPSGATETLTSAVPLRGTEQFE